MVDKKVDKEKAPKKPKKPLVDTGAVESPPKAPKAPKEAKAAPAEPPPPEAEPKAPEDGEGEAKKGDKKGDKKGGVFMGFVRAARASTKQYWSTGIFSLDAVLGGGLQAGRFHQFEGDTSAGKTYACLNAVAVVQKSCRRCKHRIWGGKCGCRNGPAAGAPVCAYVQTEGDFDTAWAERLGVDTEALLLGYPESGEALFDNIIDMMHKGKLDFLVIDSLAFLASHDEVTKTTGDKSPGVHARMFGKAFRKMMAEQVRAQGLAIRDPDYSVPTVLCTNQKRFKVGVMFGDPSTTTGGEAPKFAVSTSTRFSRAKVFKTKDDEPVLAEFNLTNTKNKTGTPFRKGAYGIQFRPTETHDMGAVLDETELLRIAQQVGALTKESKVAWRWEDAPWAGERHTVQDWFRILVSDEERKWRMGRQVLERLRKGNGGEVPREADIDAETGEVVTVIDGEDVPEGEE